MTSKLGLVSQKLELVTRKLEQERLKEQMIIQETQDHMKRMVMVTQELVTLRQELEQVIQEQVFQQLELVNQELRTLETLVQRRLKTRTQETRGT